VVSFLRALTPKPCTTSTRGFKMWWCADWRSKNVGRKCADSWRKIWIHHLKQWFWTFWCSRHTFDINFCGTLELERRPKIKIRIHLFLSDVICCIKHKIIVKQKDYEILIQIPIYKYCKILVQTTASVLRQEAAFRRLMPGTLAWWWTADRLQNVDFWLSVEAADSTR
jgi:hypothetical protein